MSDHVYDTIYTFDVREDGVHRTEKVLAGSTFEAVNTLVQAYPNIEYFIIEGSEKI